MTTLVITLVALLSLLAAAAVTRRRGRTIVVTVSGPSMEPTLRPGDRVRVRRSPDAVPRRGDVVVVEEPGPCRPGEGGNAAGTRWVVKRIAAVAGDPEPPHLPAWDRQPSGLVPHGRLVLLGDNPAGSRDSRHYGTVRADQVLGVVVRWTGRP
ncbi:S26 family signal peptidase [Nonomuraea sp. SMC257]|uniref:S26 family signal peptidase n=1 Tax=Nonomuraea montanisoli TaxID=2741721 RepID=A0A7Y6I733_9ACTN|nr:S26 family signal peptidase [Nonomuraea montanisoli]NUW32907.1 S26 family signal peptidase [Nonomuraea montanisoli]